MFKLLYIISFSLAGLTVAYNLPLGWTIILVGIGVSCPIAEIAHKENR